MSWDSLRLKLLPLIFKRSSALLPSSYYKKPYFFKKSWHQAEVGGRPRLMLLALIFLSNTEWGFAKRIRCLFKLVLVGPLPCFYLYSKSWCTTWEAGMRSSQSHMFLWCFVCVSDCGLRGTFSMLRHPFLGSFSILPPPWNAFLSIGVPEVAWYLSSSCIWGMQINSAQVTYSCILGKWNQIN